MEPYRWRSQGCICNSALNISILDITFNCFFSRFAAFRMATTDEIPASSSSSAAAAAAGSINRDTGSYSSYSNNRESSGALSSTSASQVWEEEEARDRDQEHQHPHQFTQPEIEQQQNGIRFRGSLSLFDDASVIRDDTWSCVILILTFWFFVSMTLILGIYGPASLTLGPNTSLLIEPNPIFVQSIRVEELDDKNPAPMLYGFYKSPPLDVVENWSMVYNVSVPVDSHKEWIFYLNKGSEVSISYSVNSPSSSVFLVIAQGKGGLAQWLEHPTYPNTTLSWNIIQGSGLTQQNIWTSSFYYVAVGNMNSEKAEQVELRLTIRAFLYNTTTAYCNCNFADSICSLKVLFPSGNAVVLTSPPKQGSLGDEWNVRLSYGPRWTTYIVGIAGMTVLMLAAFNFLNNFQFVREDGTTVQFSQATPERAPLLLHKDDDLSSWGSSYDSLSNDEQEHEGLVAGGSLEGKPSKDGEDGNTQRLCAICFDAPRDCFFLPCGHCVACFACGMRIVEAAGTCPICRRNMKKVKKIFSV